MIGDTSSGEGLSPARLMTEFRWLYLFNLAMAGTFGVLLFILPGLTDLYGPWIIPNPHSAYLVGAAYLGATVYYVLALRRNSWPEARNGLGGLVVFSLVLLVATMFHWERFRPYHPTTLGWLVLYYLPPVGYPILYRIQATRTGNAPAQGVDISGSWRAWLVLRGSLYLILFILGLIFAQELAGAWPWPITPLEIRVFMGQLSVVAWGAVPALLRDLRWRHNRLGMLLVGVIGAVQLLGVLIGGSPYAWGTPLGILLPLMFLEWLLTTLAMFFTYRDR